MRCGRFNNTAKEWISVVEMIRLACIAIGMFCFQVDRAVALSIEEFVGMSNDDQRTFVRESLIHWRDGSHNVSVESTTVLATVPAPNGVIEDGAEDLVATYPCKLYRRGGDYRAVVAWYEYGEDDKNETIFQNVESNFRTDTGRVRSWTKDSHLRGEIHGRVCSKENGLIRFNRYMHWFERHFGDPRDFTIAEAILCCSEDSVSFTRNSRDGIDMKCMYKRPESSMPTTYVFSLDPSRDWFPTRDYHRMELPDGWWFEQITTVEEMRNVDGMWYPWRVVTGNMNDTAAARGASTKLTTTVSSLTVGDVTDEDLEVTFPVGTIVYDEFQDKWSGADPSNIMESPNTASDKLGRKWRLIINVVLIVVIAGAIIGYRAKKRRVN